MTAAGPTVFVVDDDEAARESVRRLMESAGLAVQTFPDARTFLAAYDPAHPGCLVLDIRMPGMSGLELQAHLGRLGRALPIIIISAHGDVDKAVRAMRQGAIDFLPKPYKGGVLLERIRQALALDARQRRAAAARAALEARLAHLSPREREVMERLVAGQTCKQIGLALGLSPKTVDVHRRNILIKMQVDSPIELVRQVALVRSQDPALRPDGELPPLP